MQQNANLCIRCGKVRIFDKTWKEYIGTSLIIRTRSVCADVSCQKIVDGELLARKEKNDLHAQKRMLVQQRRGRPRLLNNS